MSLHPLAMSTNKRYLIIDQQIVRHFVHFSESLSTTPLPFYATHIITPFFQGSQLIMIKGRDFSQS